MQEPDWDRHLSEYREKGCTVIPGLLTPAEVRELSDAADALQARAATMDEGDDVLELDPGHTRDAPRIRRIRTPHRAHPVFDALVRHPRLMALVTRVIGPDVRLSHSKVNTKSGDNGSPIEWHQDWAFAPHTHMGLCIAAVMLDDCGPESGPLMVMPGSHRGPLLEHHGADGYFVGAIDVRREGLRIEDAVPLLGPAGSVTLHHPLAIHGSAPNRSGRMRRMGFLEYAAADAFPLFYGVEWDEYMSRVVAGHGDGTVRCEPVTVKLPFPTRAPGSIFESQTQFTGRYFEVAEGG